MSTSTKSYLAIFLQRLIDLPMEIILLHAHVHIMYFFYKFHQNPLSWLGGRQDMDRRTVRQTGRQAYTYIPQTCMLGWGCIKISTSPSR